MSFAQDISVSVQAVANTLHTNDIKPDSDSYIAALRSLRDAPTTIANPVDDALRAACELVLAYERLGKSVAHAEKTLRGKIADVFAETGCPGVYTSGHHVVPVEGQRSVIITDAAALAAAHPDLMNYPTPSPDRRAIGSRLRKEPVVGAEYSNEQGAPGVRFTPLKKA